MDIENSNNTQDYEKMKLLMLMVVRNEEELIEKNIRFHHAMGVDGFMVINHNSTDKTTEILEKLFREGIVIDLYGADTEVHQHSIWVNTMVARAVRHHKADWIMHADADEFYYSKSLNLKKSISLQPNANVLWMNGHQFFPDDREDFFNCPYFTSAIEDTIVPAVLHKAEGVKYVTNGNHNVYMKDTTAREKSKDICFFHYNIQNYKNYEGKAKRWQANVDAETPNWRELPPDVKPNNGKSCHIYELVGRYEKGTLREHYDSLYNEQKRNELLASGELIEDYSVRNFLKEKNII